jgi:hypothetical protein
MRRAAAAKMKAAKKQRQCITTTITGRSTDEHICSQLSGSSCGSFSVCNVCWSCNMHTGHSAAGVVCDVVVAAAAGTAG